MYAHGEASTTRHEANTPIVGDIYIYTYHRGRSREMFSGPEKRVGRRDERSRGESRGESCLPRFFFVFVSPLTLYRALSGMTVAISNNSRRASATPTAAAVKLLCNHSAIDAIPDRAGPYCRVRETAIRVCSLSLKYDVGKL